MTPHKGVADDQLGRYYRKTMAIADRLGKSLDPNTVLWLLQRIHDGEEFLFPGNNDPALRLVDTFDVPAIDRFVPKAMFTRVNDPAPQQGFSIGSGKVWLRCDTSYELFKEIFLYGKNGKLERNIDPTTLRFHRFNDHGPFSWKYHPPAILAELGFHHTVRLGQIWHLLELDAMGKSTPLLTDSKKNVFYAHGRDGNLYGFQLTKYTHAGHKPYWSMWVHSIAQPNNYCYNYDQVISP